MAQELKNSQRLSDTVAHQLEQRILEGALKAGDRLPAEREFALELGVSRPSLREAIQKLASKGLLYSRQGGGTYVADQLNESLANPWAQMLEAHPGLEGDLLEFRALLETQCAEWAASRATASIARASASAPTRFIPNILHDVRASSWKLVAPAWSRMYCITAPTSSSATSSMCRREFSSPLDTRKSLHSAGFASTGQKNVLSASTVLTNR